MAYEIPVTQARAELAELINRVVYGEERVVVTRHGKPLVGLVSAADLERLERLEAADQERSESEEILSTVSGFRDAHGGAVPHGARRFGIAAEHRGPAAGDRRPGQGS
ncbi:type II toxin-antitoxin system Phd/YefM family antitoxin [Streptomyces sp. B15]|uniref:type II toxin-antitoxin system Phd/YefM family antitoxin n=1 Tax=Streptomyces sp. B15 TaxID=1537797 RepID=UPI000C1A67C5|nr:type II toxin-antitoxin system Phd/YefM family antitoxin [Streptomyces sp. B15]MBQ1125180.1 type II toxin-antitoxin system Phd/YefM family antitoxin [Streptomyces sp. B15]